MKKLSGILNLLAFILLFNNTEAQVICTDVNPDIVNTNNATLDIDLNNDATPDFRLTSVQIGTLGFVIVQGSQIGTSNYVLTNGSGDATPLALNTIISPTSTTWTQMNSTNQQMILVMGTTVTGPWAGVTDQYLGLRFVVGANTYYGWARFSFSSSANSYTFKSYAYQSTPGIDIVAGQGCSNLAPPTFTLPTTICAGDNVTLVANTGTVNAFAYNWLSLPQLNFTNPNSSVTTVSFSAAAVYTIGLAIVSGTDIVFSTNTVQVHPAPTVSVTPSTFTACPGASVTLTAAGTASSYTWSGLSGILASGGATAVVSTTTTAVYKVVGALGGCKDSATSLIIVNPVPLLNPFVSSYSLCTHGYNQSRNSVSVSVGGGYSVALEAGDFNAVNTSSGTIVLAPSPPLPASSTQRSATLTISKGQCPIKFPLSFSIIPNPTVEITSAGGTVCAESAITFTAAGGTSYNWTSSVPASIMGAGNSTVLVKPGTTATYWVYATTEGCHSQSDSVMLQVLELPALSATDVTACPAQEVNLAASGASSYSWTGPGGFSGSGASVATSAATPGTYGYTVNATGSNTCVATLNVNLTVSECTSLKEPGLSANIKVYPQPASDVLFIESGEIKGIQLSIYDVTGKLVLTREISTTAGINTNINVAALARGYYTFTLSKDNVILFQGKVIKS